MNASDNERKKPGAAGDSPLFLTTRWSLVISAQQKGDERSVQALGELCRAYWFPLYAHVRRTGRAPADAEDLTQAFFERLLEKDWLAAVDRERGRFRSFLLASLKNFLANEWDRANAAKRGGGLEFVPLAILHAEDRFQTELSFGGSPDKEFDRRWALAVLDEVLNRLQREHDQAGKALLFQNLKGTLGAERSEISYPQLSRDLEMSEGALRVAVHRLRQRYRALLREEIAQTVASPADVDDELSQLFAALTG